MEKKEQKRKADKKLKYKREKTGHEFITRNAFSLAPFNVYVLS